MFGTIDMRRRHNALKLLRRRAFVPLAHGGELRERIGTLRIEIERRVKDELVTDQPARVVARRIIIIGPKMICRSITKVADAINIEESDFSAAALIAVTDDDDGVFGHEHLVIPGVARIDVRAKRIDGRNGFEQSIADGDSEETAAPQYHQMIAVKFDDAAFIDAGVLRVRD